MKAEPKARTGQERFYQRFPQYPRQEEEYLGDGAMMVSPIEITKEFHDKLFLEDIRDY